MFGLEAIELALITVALWAALRPVVRALRPAARWGTLVVLFAFAALVAWTALAVRRPAVIEAEVADRPVRVASGGYVSSDTCRECHPGEYDSWHASYHRTMTQVATPETVLPALDGAPIEVGGARYALRRRGDDVTITMPDPAFNGPARDAPPVERRLVLTTGSHHEQDFWFASGDDRAVSHLPIVYRIAERRWLPNGATFIQPPPPPDARLGTDHGGWNRNCIQCHATAGRPRVDADGVVRTEVGEHGIACESCHGPGAAHVAANRDPLRRYALHYDTSKGGDGDPTIVNPRRLSPERQSEVCGQCHMVSTVTSPAAFPEWNAHGPAFRPGAPLADTRDILPSDRPELARFVDGRFWSDGVVRVTGRELHGVRASACAEHGALSCLSCHDMHQIPDDSRPPREWANDQLTPKALGDGACTACHAEVAADVPAHTHHAAGSAGSACYDCHMPYTTWGLLTAIRSHQIESPSVATTLATGRPNACNLCHLDRPLAWAAERLEAWYGTPMPALGDDDRTLAAGVRWLVAGDAGQRALAAWGMGWAPARAASGRGLSAGAARAIDAGTARAIEAGAVRSSDAGAARSIDVGALRSSDAWMVPLLAQALDDPYDAVRFVAVRSLAARADVALGDYDFLAPSAARGAVRDAIVRAFDGRARAVDANARVTDANARATDAADTASLLQDGAGRLDRAALAALAAQRDERPVVLKE